MPDGSWSQTTFSAGEWSPPFRGRLDDKEYETALSLCLNYIPNQEGSLSARSGFKRIGLTNFGSPAKLLAARFSNWLPYVAEHTGGNPGHLRLWANGLPLFHALSTLLTATGNPPTFTGDTTVVSTWTNGDSILIDIENTFTEFETDGRLANREFYVTIVSAPSGTFTLTDAITLAPLTGAVTTSGTKMTAFRILDIPTPYAYVEDIRQVQFTYQRTLGTDNSGAHTSLPEHRVSYLQIPVSPRSLVYDPSAAPSSWVKTTLFKEEFIDGPYLDSITTNVPMTVSGTTGTITIRLHGYSTLAIYRNAVTTWDGTNYFVSLVTNNKGNALPTPPAATPFWASMPLAYSSGTTYFLGQPATRAPTTDGVQTIYYSIQAGNINHTPPSVLWWATTPAAWDIAATYSDGAVSRLASINYVSLVGANVGNSPDVSPTFWLPVNFETALQDIKNVNTGWPSQTQFFNNDYGHGDASNIARLIRLKASPEPWDTQFTYAANDLVNYRDNIYKALGTTTGDIPDQITTAWEIQTKTILWTWAKFAANPIDSYTATITIMGDDLPNSNPVWEWRLGVFSDTTGWPTCGTYHEGRLWFSGAMPNRFDAGRSNKGYDFSPTAPDGTVADNNGISYTLNAEQAETIKSMTAIADGIAVFTDAAEWLISASSMNDPLTPTSIQAHRTTSFSSADAEVTRLPAAIAVVQNGGRRILEYRTFVDLASYQSRLNTVDLTRKCQHLTGDGVIQTAYQSLPQPVLWGCPGGIVNATPQLAICPLPTPGVQQTHAVSIGTLFGLAYSRTPDVSYVAPFTFEHGWSLKTGIQKTVGSIAVQKGALSTAEYLYATVLDEVNANYYVEMMMPTFESSPLDDTYNQDGTVATYGTLASAYFIDSGITPASCKVATDGLSVTFYGLYGHQGETVQFTCRGKYIGDYAINSSGEATVTFTAWFTIADLGRAMYRTAYNATLLPAKFQRFWCNVNGNSGADLPGASTVADFFYGQFGYKYRRRLKTLRPSTPGANGPAFAKIRRNERMGVYLDAGQEVSIGDTFNTLFPLDLQVPRTDGKVSSLAVGRTDFVTGIFRDEVNSDHTFDGELCAEQTRPVPGSVLAIGGFEGLTDS